MTTNQAGGSGGGESSKSVATIPSLKPAVGSVRELPSRTQVFLSAKQGYQDVCNYVFGIAGK